MPPERSLLRTLTVVAAVLGVLAPFAGSPYAAAHARIDVTELARVVSREEDHVTAVELAQWIKDRRPGLRVVDVRDAEAFTTYHIATAERLPLDSLIATPFRSDETIVLYSDGGAHAAQGWTFLRALGLRRVYFLRGGLNEWLESVISPTLPEAPGTAEREEVDRIAALSRYFGGKPTRGAVELTGSAVPLPLTRAGARSDASTGAAIIARMRKRGC